MIFPLFIQAIDLMKYKQEIFAYVESRMTFIAPNLSIIVGASTAAKLMGKINTNIAITFVNMTIILVCETTVINLKVIN